MKEVPQAHDSGTKRHYCFANPSWNLCECQHLNFILGKHKQIAVPGKYPTHQAGEGIGDSLDGGLFVFADEAGEQIHADVFVVAGGDHCSNHGYPQHEHSYQRIAQKDARVKQITRYNLIDGKADHSAQQHHQNATFQASELCAYGFNQAFSIKSGPIVCQVP